MTTNCGKWFKRKGDLVVHLEVHSKTEWKCDQHNHVTTCENYLKDHVKSRCDMDETEFPYKCAVCNKKYLYRQQLAQCKNSHLQN